MERTMMKNRCWCAAAVIAPLLLASCVDRGMEDRLSELQRQSGESAAAVKKLEARLAQLTNENSAAHARLEFDLAQLSREGTAAREAPPQDWDRAEKEAAHPGKPATASGAPGGEGIHADGYTPELRAQMMKRCRKDGGKSDAFCACVAKKIEQTFRIDELDALGKSYAAGSPPARLKALVKQCE